MRDTLKDLTVDVVAPTREQLNISFGYQRSSFYGGFSRSSSSSSFKDPDSSPDQSSSIIAICNSGGMKHRSGSFSCLSGAALSANATLANTNILGDEILPNLDSPNSFRRLTSSPSLSRLSDDSTDRSFPRSSDSSSFLNSSMDVVQTAGGAAGEDRVQAVCSEENGWLFCGIYDGFNGRDAADFLAATLYETVACSLKNLEWRAEQVRGREEAVDDFIRAGVVECLKDAVCHAESGFLHRVEEEMEDRPDLVSVGTCVLVGLLYGDDIYVLNLGDSRAILATEGGGGGLRAVQMSETHTVDNEAERMKVVADHPDDPRPIKNGRLKGKLKVTRAFGVGYLKQARMNAMLMGILRIENLCSPPYVYSDPYTTTHRVSEKDHFIVLGSDGLFDFFKNEEIVKLVHLFIQHNPLGDPAKYLVELLVQRAAHNAGISVEELLTIPLGRRRKYHDDVTVIVIILGNKQRTSTASTSLS